MRLVGNYGVIKSITQDSIYFNSLQKDYSIPFDKHKMRKLNILLSD